MHGSETEERGRDSCDVPVQLLQLSARLLWSPFPLSPSSNSSPSRSHCRSWRAAGNNPRGKAPAERQEHGDSPEGNPPLEVCTKRIPLSFHGRGHLLSPLLRFQWFHTLFILLIYNNCGIQFKRYLSGVNDTGNRLLFKCRHEP